MTNTYNDGLEAAAIEAEAFADQSAREGWTGPYIASHTAKAVAAAIRDLKRPEPDAPETSDPRDALIKELMGALQIVDDDVRHHLRSEKIYHSLLRAHAVEAVRNALSKVEGK